MDFRPNGRVRIDKENVNDKTHITVTAQQNFSTPGVRVQYNLEKNKRYKIHILGYKNCDADVKLFIGDRKLKRFFFDKYLEDNLCAVDHVFYNDIDEQINIGMFFDGTNKRFSVKDNFVIIHWEVLYYVG